jgi:hypothetical protein
VYNQFHVNMSLSNRHAWAISAANRCWEVILWFRALRRKPSIKLLESTNNVYCCWPVVERTCSESHYKNKKQKASLTWSWWYFFFLQGSIVVLVCHLQQVEGATSAFS